MAPVSHLARRTGTAQGAAASERRLIKTFLDGATTTATAPAWSVSITDTVTGPKKLLLDSAEFTSPAGPLPPSQPISEAL